MQPANDPTVNYKQLVEKSYDRCAAAYEAARRGTAHPELGLLIDRLPEDAHLLDLGCGAGVPVAQTLAYHFAVTGVDISGEQVRRARNNVPIARFIHSDIMALEFPPAPLPGPEVPGPAHRGLIPASVPLLRTSTKGVST